MVTARWKNIPECVEFFRGKKKSQQGTLHYIPLLLIQNVLA